MRRWQRQMVLDDATALMGRAMAVAWRSGGPALKIGQMEEPNKETAATTGRLRSGTNRRRRCWTMRRR